MILVGMSLYRMLSPMYGGQRKAPVELHPPPKLTIHYDDLPPAKKPMSDFFGDNCNVWKHNDAGVRRPKTRGAFGKRRR